MSQYEQIGGGGLYEGVVGQSQLPMRQLQHSPGQQQFLQSAAAQQQHLQHQSHGGHHHSSSPHKVKELEEARQRIAQMEKTMRGGHETPLKTLSRTGGVILLVATSRGRVRELRRGTSSEQFDEKGASLAEARPNWAV
ncbi:coiled-coil domain-containing protein 102A-like [Tropilaelaps mercedesae]|uniref:Coiled-coil domain-containing protein 102A-like n=1 Tax=Tropilaelaps mercedesae TaxID=418985 RepID=A0A1V9XVA3_9ACAR|nr:coiled-coil domain-containing protein 102A-like [Tropilaelaps mercedesae]